MPHVPVQGLDSRRNHVASPTKYDLLAAEVIRGVGGADKGLLHG
jgi:hypothetical protein